jgi:hypothetical protein
MMTRDATGGQWLVQAAWWRALAAGLRLMKRNGEPPAGLEFSDAGPVLAAGSGSARCCASSSGRRRRDTRCFSRVR